MRIPRSAVWQRFAIADAVVLPSPMAVNTSSSMAAFKASVRWCALIVWKNNWGDGCWAAEEVDMNFLSLFRQYLSMGIRGRYYRIGSRKTISATAPAIFAASG